MAKNSKADMSCARVKKYTSSDVSKAERHNERKNETYENMNVIAERIPYNVHFKEPTSPTYMEQLKRKRTIASTCSYASFSAIIVSHDTESKKLST